MRGRASVLWVAACFAMLLPMCGFAPDPPQKVGADLIVTVAPVYEPLAALRGQERFPKGAQLQLVHEGEAEPLVSGFAASADANVSFDGKTVLFAGKQAAGDPWQIWELTVADRSVRKVTATATDAVRPLYLPGWRMVFAQRTPKGFQMESAQSGLPPVFAHSVPTAIPERLTLTHMQGSALPVDVLMDGRILFEAGFPIGSGSTPELYLVYSDGSGVESYRCDHGAARWGGKQLASGDVVFTHGVASARFTTTLAHEERIAAPQAEYAGDLAETAAGAWLVSTRAAAGTFYEIKLWKPGSAAMETVLAKSGENLVEPVLLAPRTRPKEHPSALHPWDCANLLALDARFSRDGELRGTPASVRLETQDAAGHAVALGTAPVEQDGSFFVKAPGNKPIRFAVLDAKGAVLRQEHGRFWSRGGEQRICVGCHTGPERAQENRVAAVLLRTTTPVDLTGASIFHQAQTGSAQQTAQGGR
jgi:hypothetical protein